MLSVFSHLGSFIIGHVNWLCNDVHAAGNNWSWCPWWCSGIYLPVINFSHKSFRQLIVLVYVSCIWHSSPTVLHAPSQRRCLGEAVSAASNCIETSIQMSFKFWSSTLRSSSSACEGKLSDSTQRDRNLDHSFLIPFGSFVMCIRKKINNSIALISVLISSAILKSVGVVLHLYSLISSP